ncbi:MAG TPA: hypothetical protein VK806_10700 [Bacteroidia bacterium]|jgi:hypothetical protein|nr:hypothetical protein [Bacteroidia bacterium]
MKTKNLGIVLIIIGAIMMVYTGFNYISTKNVVDIGDIKINKTENHPVQWSPILGGILLVSGVVLMATTKK